MSRDVVFCEDIYPFGNEPKGFEFDNAFGSPTGLHLALDDGLVLYRDTRAHPNGTYARGCPQDQTQVKRPMMIS